MSRIQKCLWAVVALTAALFIAPASASARGPVRYLVARPVVRAPVAVVRTTRIVTPPYRPYYAPYYAPRVYLPQHVYVAPVVYVY